MHGIASKPAGGWPATGPALALAAWLLVAVVGQSCLASDLSQRAARLFVTAGSTTPAAISDARGQYLALRKSYPSDRSLDYAYALVLLKQHKFPDALKAVSNYLEVQGGPWNVFATKIWLELNEHDFDRALETALELAEYQADAQRPRAAQEGTEPARFLGMVFGYMEQVRPESGSARLKRIAKQNALGLMTAEQRRVFDEGYANVGELLSELRVQQLAAQGAAGSQRTGQQEHQALKPVTPGEEPDDEARRQVKTIESSISDLRIRRAKTSGDLAAERRRRAGQTWRSLSRDVQRSIITLDQQKRQLDSQIADLQAQVGRLLTSIDADQLAAERQAAAQGFQPPAAASKTPAVPSGRLVPLTTYLPSPFDAETGRLLTGYARR